jgi:hypothetical protein
MNTIEKSIAMKSPLIPHPLDQRPIQEVQDNLIALNLIQGILEDKITSYAIDNHQNLFDQDNQVIIRAVGFSRGLEEYQIVLTPYGSIRAWTRDTPSDLIHEIHHALIGFEVIPIDNDNKAPIEP